MGYVGEDEDTATLAAEAVAAAVAAGDATAFAEALAVQKKLPGFSKTNEGGHRSVE